jgi:hypothetical protein
LIFAEINEVNTSGTDFHAQDFAHHALGFADMLAGILNGEAVGGGDRCG